ncbi:MAG: lipopolysaccharide heptosyltransferase II [Gammaproteobacteria bacterium]|jgi:heptosyltransferase-2|nr:lipopolysaccharide heptosyltransferase II [Gammaproteobacteria bacterium]
MSDTPRRYLIVGPSWVGDMVMAQSLFITLKKHYPDCIIDVIAPAWSLPILERMPQINRGIALAVGHGEFSLLRRIRLGRSLRKHAYSHAIVLPRSWKSALGPFFAGAKVRTGYRGEMRYGLLNDIRQLDKNRLKQTVQRFVAHAYDSDFNQVPDIPFPRLEVDTSNCERLIKELGLDLVRPVIAMMPGAEYGPAKQWPENHYRQLTTLLLDKGYQVWVIGSAKEKALGDAITAGQGTHAINLCGRTELVDAVDLLSCAEQAVTNDSGLMHVAAAVGIKLNVIYGSSTPDYTPPLTDNAVIHYKNLYCSPCFKRVCPLGHTNCLNYIECEDVLIKIIG